MTPPPRITNNLVVSRSSFLRRLSRAVRPADHSLDQPGAARAGALSVADVSAADSVSICASAEAAPHFVADPPMPGIGHRSHGLRASVRASSDGGTYRRHRGA